MEKKVWMGIKIVIAAVGLIIATGCATPRSIPATYYQIDEPVIKVDVTKIPNKPVMIDSGQGGLIGAMVNATRASTMKKVMGDLNGSTVSSLLKQKIETRMEEQFFIEDKTEYLLANVVVTRWGWYCPTAALGIRAGNYQLQIWGDVIIYDVQTPKKKKKVGFMRTMAKESLGSDPKSVNIQEILLKTIDAFCNQTTSFLLSQAPPPEEE